MKQSQKRCVKCGETKPLSEFYRMAGMRDGHRNDCKQCNLAAKAERYRANPQREIERVQRWRRENPAKFRSTQRRLRASPEWKRRDRSTYLKRKFGITLDQYEEMLAGQDGGCALCGRPPSGNRALHVDHDHSTGQVRGLLCFTCNNALGDFEDDADRLVTAANYLGPVPKDPALTARLAALGA